MIILSFLYFLTKEKDKAFLFPCLLLHIHAHVHFYNSFSQEVYKNPTQIFLITHYPARQHAAWPFVSQFSLLSLFPCNKAYITYFCDPQKKKKLLHKERQCKRKKRKIVGQILISRVGFLWIFHSIFSLTYL